MSDPDVMQEQRDDALHTIELLERKIETMTTQLEAMSEELEAQMAEAGASINWQMLDEDGVRCQLTLRVPSAKQQPALIAYRKKRIAELKEQDWTLVEQPPAKTAAAGNGSLPTKRQTDDSGEKAGQEHVDFRVERLVANVAGGKAYWKLQGGRYSKHGVTIWPETLGLAGIEVDQLDPTQTYDVDGTATALLVDGKVKKVVSWKR